MNINKIKKNNKIKSNKWKIGQKLIYLKTGEKVKILEVISDLENGWYYTIVFKDGRERQTTYSHLGKIKIK